MALCSRPRLRLQQRCLLLAIIFSSSFTVFADDAEHQTWTQVNGLVNTNYNYTISRDSSILFKYTFKADDATSINNYNFTVSFRLKQMKSYIIYSRSNCSDGK